MEHKEIEDVIEVLSDLKDDIAVPKNVRSSKRKQTYGTCTC